MMRIASLARPVALVALGVCLGLPPAAAESSAKDVLKNYADIAAAGYADSLATAKNLQLAVNQLLANPTDQNMLAARAAWVAARIPYMQTEAYRFGNTIVDDWEGKVNSWPLDEGLIDYVVRRPTAPSRPRTSFTPPTSSPTPRSPSAARSSNTSKITKELLADKLQEAGGVEANVATGYHAVEFLLWGQDLNGTGPGNGNRPASDYDTKKCTGGHCDRRAQYLTRRHRPAGRRPAWMAAQWAPGGEARKTIEDGSAEAGLTAILTGLGSLSYGELAGERMKLGLMIHDPEEEHDCFSDNTYRLALFRRARHPQRLCRPLSPGGRLGGAGPERVGPGQGEVA